jgi:hypothetical protein
MVKSSNLEFHRGGVLGVGGTRTSSRASAFISTPWQPHQPSSALTCRHDPASRGLPSRWSSTPPHMAWPPMHPCTQNDFLLPDSPLCVKCGMGCLPKVQEAVAAARSSGVPVFWVIREHDPSGEEEAC